VSRIQSSVPTDDLLLHDVLKNSYAKTKAKNMKGYNLDESLSNHNQQVYYNPTKKSLLLSGTGTHNLSDIGTDIYLAAGHLKDTNRYKEAEKTLKKAKQKYGVDNAIITGHSLFGTIGSYIGNPEKDQIYTLDKGATIGQPIRKGEKAYRTSGDLVSLLNANDPHIKNLINPNQQTGHFIKDALNSHNVDNIKNSNITI
jgi:uncharacterized protein YdcH (DUF465 family)